MKHLVFTFLFSFLLSAEALGDWKVDFSRRQQDIRQKEVQEPVYQAKEKTLFDMVTQRQAPIEDLVIVNTEKGFLPSRVSLKKNQRYRVHVININREQKNLSFMMDAFSQHHGTYFGDKVVFEIEPRKQGLFDFHCPETAARGQIVINSEVPEIDSPLDAIRMRQPASE